MYISDFSLPGTFCLKRNQNRNRNARDICNTPQVSRNSFPINALKFNNLVIFDCQAFVPFYKNFSSIFRTDRENVKILLNPSCAELLLPGIESYAVAIPSNSQNMEYLHFSPLQESFHSLEKWLFALESYSDDTYIVIVANKCDLDFEVPVEVSSIWATLTPEILDT